MVSFNDKDVLFNEVMDQINSLFFDSPNKHYCCEPEQIVVIKKLIDGLEQCGGNTIQMKPNLFSEKEISQCTDPDILAIALDHELVEATLATSHMYMAAILCYYISSRISGGHDFGIQTTLSKLIPGMDTKTMFVRAAISEFMLQILFNKYPRGHPCFDIVKEFKHDLLSLKEFSGEKVEEWSGIDVTSPEVQAKAKKITDAQAEIRQSFVSRAELDELGGGKIKKTKRNKRKRKTKKR